MISRKKHITKKIFILILILVVSLATVYAMRVKKADNRIQKKVNGTESSAAVNKYTPENTLLTVNGSPLTKSEYDSYKMTNPNSDDKILIESFIKENVIKQEATRLKIYPDKDILEKCKRDTELAVYDEQNGSKETQEYIKKLGISKEYYVKKSMQIFYNMWQRGAFYEYLDSKGLDREQYVNDLLKKSKIKAIDANYKWVEKLYK